MNALSKKQRKLNFKDKQIGDVYEIQTSKGLAYFQYTHEHIKPPKWGSLIRVLRGFYGKRPAVNELAEIVKKPHRFQVFLFLNQAIKEKEVAFVGNFQIPGFSQKFPIFKNTNTLPKGDQREAIWSLWDGEKSWRVGKLSEEEQMKYPFHSLCDTTTLVRDIEEGVFFNRILC